jgi:hypothetical protein
MMHYLIKALVKKLEGDIAISRANIQVYLDNSAGIGEHSDIVESIEGELGKLAEAEDKLNTALEYFGEKEDV